MAQQDREAPGRQPGPEHQRLEVFLGRWEMEGQQKEGPFGPAASVSASQTYEWLPGGFFLVMRFDGRVGDSPAACIEITGYDSVKQSYPTHTFYNDGNSMQWRLHQRNGTWLRTGSWQRSGKTLHVRCTTLFLDAGKTMTSKWEYSNNGSAWQTFWDVKATKAP